MILIIEGANKTGKTSLIKAIKEKYPSSSVIDFRTHEVSSKIGDIRFLNFLVGETVVNMLEALDSKDKIIILDRFHLSEVVYGELNRGYYNHDMFALDKRLAKLDTKLLLVISEFEHIKIVEEKAKLFEIQNKFIEQSRMTILNKEVVILDELFENDEINPDSIAFSL